MANLTMAKRPDVILDDRTGAVIGENRRTKPKDIAKARRRWHAIDGGGYRRPGRRRSYVRRHPGLARKLGMEAVRQRMHKHTQTATEEKPKRNAQR